MAEDMDDVVSELKKIRRVLESIDGHLSSAVSLLDQIDTNTAH